MLPVVERDAPQPPDLPDSLDLQLQRPPAVVHEAGEDAVEGGLHAPIGRVPATSDLGQREICSTGQIGYRDSIGHLEKCHCKQKASYCVTVSKKNFVV